ncbi:hypothetical protein B0I35DRAFT_446753 [Stachybotrys elegans]|uniref:Uncharacterized protein n=1 Tax=Stachybotrys elegans TaxID=80388 RepID=A0A8K0SD00_9HYPO|nr:hypothetical protein B0I35DRAFT_446753 [Stachybotrys elegans]
MDTSIAASGTVQEMRSQLIRPGDVFSLLLLIGGDTVQKAMAQLTGKSFRLLNHGPEIRITPVAFSFGWVAHAFMSLMWAAGDERLMPSAPDFSSIVVNGENGFTRTNQSWILGRLLRDYEATHEVDPATVSLRIDIYDQQPVGNVDVDWIWWQGWLAIIIQIGVSIVPWALSGDWGIFMVTLAGTTLALFTGSLSQWKAEKWAGRLLGAGKRKVTCLTQGNGSFHIMVFIGGPGAWDIESLAVAKSKARKDTFWIIIALAVLWTALLITASGLEEHTWFLVAVGGIGMLQNIGAAGARRKPGAANIHFTRHEPRPQIIGIRQRVLDNGDSYDDLGDESGDWLSPKSGNDIDNVMGALIELEKTVPKAGLALMGVFFPGGLMYEKGRIRYKMQRKFWKRALRTARDRSSAAWSQSAKPTLNQHSDTV